MGSYYNYDNSHVQQPSESQVHHEGQELSHIAQSYVDYYHEPSRKNAKRRDGQYGGESVEDFNVEGGIGLFLIAILVAAAVLLLPSVLVTRMPAKLLGAGNNCHTNSDCDSNTCLAGVCFDKCIKDGTCLDGQFCLGDSNCESDESVCRFTNGTGKALKSCERCRLGQRECPDEASCGLNVDCQSNLCNQNGICVEDCAATKTCRTGQRCSVTEDCLNINDACIDYLLSDDFLDYFEEFTNNNGNGLGSMANVFVNRVPEGPICADCNDVFSSTYFCRSGAQCNTDRDCQSNVCTDQKCE